MADFKPKPKSKSKPKPEQTQPQEDQPAISYVQHRLNPQEDQPAISYAQHHLNPQEDQPAISYVQHHLNPQNVTFPANDHNYTLNNHANHTMIPAPGNTCYDCSGDVYNHTDNNYAGHHHMPEFTYNDFYYNNTDNNNGFFNDVVNNNVNNNIRPDVVELMADIPEEDEAYLETFPAGYCFNPHDFELIVFYLKKKIENKFLPPNKIRSVNLYRYHPQELIKAISDEHMVENVWYFFTPRNRKYPNGTRPNRAAGKQGYWKATGADKSIVHEDGAKKSVVGYRKALVFYEGTAPNGVKTNWIMHEYRLNQPPRNKINAEDMKLDDWVLCELHKKVDRSVKISQGGQPSWDNGEPNLIYHNAAYLSKLGVDNPFLT